MYTITTQINKCIYVRAPCYHELEPLASCFSKKIILTAHKATLKLSGICGGLITAENSGVYFASEYHFKPLCLCWV